MRLLKTGLSWLWLVVVMIAIDRYSKYWVMSHLSFFEPMRILPFLNFTLAYNTGAAFSFLHAASGWQHWVLGGLALVVSAIVLVWLSRLPARQWWLNISLCLIMAGALGNAVDRALYGFVVDFLDFHIGGWHFAIFNIADSAICVGAFMMICDWLRSDKR